ncbi:hypothetical protein PENDEC_c005G01650 [Penicillium decumbens]|uniref:Uncharacterized protein n=1 Tax=Penicillium decumbens TaxID=69771 RepID=A0A1V6PG70_PENDC|nr:hypothetical protein PENDEC_c005G01650 [Penicillium decumbens]
MPRRVISRLIPLEPLDVIRAKDQRSRQLALARRNDSALTSIPGLESSIAAETARQKRSSKSPRSVNNEKKSILSTESADDSSRLVDITHDGVTEHAMPNPPQPELNEFSTFPTGDALTKDNNENATSYAGVTSPSKMISDHPEREDSTATKIQHIQNATASEDAKSMATSDEMSKSNTVSGKGKLSELSKRESAASSRPKRSTRKSYALPSESDIDWDQDLRPTDDESHQAEGHHGGNAVTSSDSEYRNSTDRKSPKRKKRQSGPDSWKSRKAVKGKTDRNAKGRDHLPQLPLTTVPIVFPRIEVSGSHAGSSSRPVDRQSEAATTKDAADAPGISFTPSSKKRRLYESQVTVENHEVIEISSSSAPSSNRSSPGHDINQCSSHVPPTSNGNTQGRGKVVGTKLSDALREAGLSSRRTDEPAIQSTGTFEAATDYKKAKTAIPRNPLTGISPLQGSLTSEASIDPGQIESKSNGSTSDSPMLPGKTTSISADYLNLPESMSFQGLSNKQIYAEIDANTNDSIEAPMKTARDSSNMFDEELANSQEFAQSLGSKADASSQTSSAAKTDHQATLLTHADQSHKTPESEKPLLTKTTREVIPLSIPRSLIVDHNGSPRITTKKNKNNTQMQSPLGDDQMGSSEMTDASSSDDDQSSDMYSPGYTPESQRTWSKFHRDIVAEYGIDTEQLIRDADRPISLKKASNSDAATCGSSHADRQRTEKLLETEPTTSPQREDDTPAETRSHIDHAKASAIAATSSPGPIGEQLSTQLATEQDTIRDVLQIYRMGCHRILDDLFRAQEERMQLYRQQMSSVKEQHTQVCRDLIRGLQELDDRVQQGP